MLTCINFKSIQYKIHALNSNKRIQNKEHTVDHYLTGPWVNQNLNNTIKLSELKSQNEFFF